MAERDSHRIIRQWNREIERELRLAASRSEAGRKWRAVVWIALWTLWLGLLCALIAHVG